MTENRITIRFSPAEIAALSSRAADLGIARAEYIRFAVGAAIRQEKIEDKISLAMDQLSSQILNFQAREAKIWKLLLRVQNAPEKAVETLEKIIEIHQGEEP